LDKLTLPPLLNEIPINQSPLLVFVLADNTPPIHAIVRTEEKDKPMKITPIRSETLCKALMSVALYDNR